jgi:ribosomal protein S18 acetylase RimI-like enzyme
LLNARLLEEISLSAWPALQTVFVDGWVVRFSNGFGRRANSVNPLYHSTRSVEENLAECEALYARRNQRVVFKISPAAQPAGLDDLLAQRGYALEAPTSVQTLPFELPTQAPAAEASIGPAASAVWSGAESVTDEWLKAVVSLTAVPERHQATLRQMLAGLAPPACFASLSNAGQIAACGLGVLHGGWLGLFDIVTHPQQRGQGYAQRLIRQLLAWGQSRGAQGAYLQVMLNNPPALALYQRLGFSEAYRYWYRVLEIGG